MLLRLSVQLKLVGPPPQIAIVWGGREKDFQRGEGKINQSNHAGEHGLVRTAHVWPGGGSHLRGERRESDRENECMIAMARKQREKDPRPRPQPPRASQARRVAGVIVGPGSVVPGPLEPSLSRDRSRTSERFEIIVGRSRIPVGPFTWKGEQSHFISFYGS